jgi:cysteine desulfurase
MLVSLYFDYAASTPVDPEVAEAVSRALTSADLQANPAATHEAGLRARARVEAARAEVAALIGAVPGEIVWTSGATEANNLAVMGAARFRASIGRHLVTVATEHVSVRAAFRRLEQEGFRVTYLVPDRTGLVAPGQVAAALQPDTMLVSVMQVNNETGVVQDIAAIGAACRNRNAWLHVDAVQAAGREPIDVRRNCVDLLTLSGHKMHGPKGVGALFLDRERARRIEPLLYGGGQQRELRPGTVATHQVIGMGVAARLALARRAEDAARMRLLRERLWTQISELPGVLLNGDPQRRACHILNCSVMGVEGESLLFALRGLALSSGAACAADSGEPSAVLRHLGRDDQLAASSIRFSVGRLTHEAEVDEAARQFMAAVTRLRALAPAA